MLGLPSTTEVMRVMPKTAFYKHLNLKPQEKKHFVAQIEKITLTNSIKASTMNIKDGAKNHEILVLQVDLKKKEIDASLLESIAKQNNHPLVFVCRYLNEMQIYLYRQRLYCTKWMAPDSFRINFKAQNIDILWDAICSKVALGVEKNNIDIDLDCQLEMSQRISNLEAEVSKLMDGSRKEKQPAKKNSLFEEAQVKRRELSRLKEGL